MMSYSLVVDDLISIELISKFEAIKCPMRGGINFPCVICQECEIGTVDIVIEDGVMIENTVNSMIIHLELPMRENDPIEQAALALLRQKLSEKLSVIQKGEWEGGEIAIMLTDGMKDDNILRQNVNKFIRDFPTEWRRLAIQAKRELTDWSEKHAKQIARAYFNKM
ncbi:MAG: hypothetical protein IH840_04970 [Candidatus Heimdallarchaeota archaeon]|nr:hypothetical protein [Candidatus Heimdallarchaeota archaeon]